MTDTGKNSILLGYALTYAAGVSAFTAMSMLFVFLRRSAQDADESTLILLVGIKFAWVFGYALGFVLLAAVLDFLTKRNPQPMNALSLGPRCVRDHRSASPSALHQRIHRPGGYPVTTTL